MMDQTEFLQLSDVAKWREYRDATDRHAALRKQTIVIQDALDTCADLLNDLDVERGGWRELVDAASEAWEDIK